MYFFLNELLVTSHSAFTIICTGHWNFKRANLAYFEPFIDAFRCTLTLSTAEMASSCGDILVKEIDKRASGQAFEVILGAPAPDAKGEFPLSPPKKKDLSLEEIQRKLEAAEERRKSHEAEVLKHLAEKREHEKERRRSLTRRWRLTKKQGGLQAAMSEKFKEKDKKLEEVRAKKETKEGGAETSEN
ncbi:unnamed protein product [Oncorhynchus mykiss]|uniref:Stathmin n=1 Tax=Oncorhynchus mykiss TaxID=8022 RepID=A0A060XNX2_ONCMY|nr:unnamed protein product [Oncorhynchus mykiss]